MDGLYMSYGLMAGYGGYVFGADGTDSGDIGLNNKGAVEAVEYAENGLVNIGRKACRTIRAQTIYPADLYGRKAAAVIGGPWSASNYKEAGLNYGAAKSRHCRTERVCPLQAERLGRLKYTKEPELAEKWLQYAANDENAYRFYEDTNEVPANLAARKKAGEQKAS
ncbi:extracellular solute-binding protein [Bacillus licheniformis]|nr:extracellular solute-binding protein [Bacillus licheniformis]